MDAHEQALETALKKAQAALAKKATGDNIDAAVKAKKALDDYRAKLAAKSDPSARRFSNLLDALEYLAEQGWKVSQSKLYQDKGKIEKERDGSYTKKALDDYASSFLERLDGSGADITDEAKRKAKAEAELMEEKLKEKKRDNEIAEGKWILKSDVESMLAGRAALLTKGLGPEFIHGHAADIVRLVGGDPAKTPDLIEHWLKVIEDQFDRYSSPMEFAVPAVAKGKDEDE